VLLKIGELGEKAGKPVRIRKAMGGALEDTVARDDGMSMRLRELLGEGVSETRLEGEPAKTSGLAEADPVAFVVAELAGLVGVA